MLSGKIKLWNQGSGWGFIEGDDGKFQGQQKLAQFLEDNPKHLNELNKRIKEML